MNDRYHIVREDLHRLYGGAIDAQTIDTVLGEEIEAAEQRARFTDFLAVTVSRAATERLEEIVAEGGVELKKRPEILFVSAHNSGRSQLATALTNHLAGDQVFVRAVGLESAGEVDPAVLEVLKERGIDADATYLEPIKARTVHRADVIVLIGVDEAPDLPGDRYVHWAVNDPVGKPMLRVREIADRVENRVRELLRDLHIEVASAA